MNARQAIVDAVVVRLKRLTLTNGYASDAGAAVYCWWPEGLPLAVVPSLIVRDTTDEIEKVGGDKVEHELSVEVIGTIEDGVTTAEACREMIRDIVHTVLDDSDRKLAGVCNAIYSESGGEIQLDQTTERVVGTVVVRFAVRYATDRGDWSENV